MATIRHAWMKQDQCLGDILVPVAVETAADQGIEQLPTALRSLFTAARENPRAPAPRIVVLGGPGTGKSVALRLIARDARALPHRDPAEAARGGWVSQVPTRSATSTRARRWPPSPARWNRGWACAGPTTTGCSTNGY